MTELRKVDLRDTDGNVIDPASQLKQDFTRSLVEQSIINQQIIIKHLEIISNTIIKEEDLIW